MKVDVTQIKDFVADCYMDDDGDAVGQLKAAAGIAEISLERAAVRMLMGSVQAVLGTIVRLDAGEEVPSDSVQKELIAMLGHGVILKNCLVGRMTKPAT